MRPAAPVRTPAMKKPLPFLNLNPEVTQIVHTGRVDSVRGEARVTTAVTAYQICHLVSRFQQSVGHRRLARQMPGSA